MALIGATEKAGSVGRTILWNLITNAFGGTVYPVNPKRPSVLGIRAYPNVAALPEPPDPAALEELLARFSQVVVEQPWIKEIDINPLLASPSKISNLVALDARVVLHPPDTAPGQLPRPAIRPYPTQYVQPWTMKDGTPVNIRPIRPEDEPLMVGFHETLSDRSVFMRYFHTLELSQRVAHDRLARICFIDYDREMALVVIRRDPQTGERAIIGVGRLSQVPATNEAEFAALIADPYQGQGLGSELLRRLVQIGRDEGLARVVAYFLPENEPMRRVFRTHGFRLGRENGMVKATLDL